MKKVLGLTIALLIAVAMLTMGAWAYWSDVESSTGNRLTAGTLDLKTDDINGTTQTLYGLSLKANGTIGGAGTIILKNAGTVNASKLTIVFSYSENDGSPNRGLNMSADATAAIIEVTTLTYNGIDQLSGVSDWNTNTYKDLQDLTHASNLGNLSGINASSTKNFVIAAKIRDGIDDNFQGDGVTATMTFTLYQ